MLEITISGTEKFLLEKTNLFNKENIISFCLLLSYGNIKNITQLYKKTVGNCEVNIQDTINLLDSKIKENNDIRLWYSSSDNENMCNLCFLIFYLSKYKDINVYICDVSDEYHWALGTYSCDEIEGLLHKTTLLDSNTRVEYELLWQKLSKENADIRVIDNNTIASYNFDYLDKLILNLLKECGEISFEMFIIKCMMNHFCHFYVDIFYKERVNCLIDIGKIKVCRIRKEKDISGQITQSNYIKIDDEYMV